MAQSSSVTPQLGGMFTQSTEDSIYFILHCYCKLGIVHFVGKRSPRLEHTLDMNGLGQVIERLIETSIHYIQYLHQTVASNIFKCHHGG